MRSVVDLPQPEGPSRTTSLPEAVAKRDAVDGLGGTVVLADGFELQGAHGGASDECIRRSFDAAPRPRAAGRTPERCCQARTRSAIVRACVAWPSDERSGAAKTLCYIGKTARFRAIKGARMSAAKPVREYQESRIEDEPILGAVLVLPSGTIEPLTWWERVLVALRLTRRQGARSALLQPREHLRQRRAPARAVGAASEIEARDATRPRRSDRLRRRRGRAALRRRRPSTRRSRRTSSTVER